MPGIHSLYLVHPPGDDGEAIEARTQGPGQRSRVDRKPSHKLLVSSHHLHPLPLIARFCLFAA